MVWGGARVSNTCVSPSASRFRAGWLTSHSSSRLMLVAMPKARSMNGKRARVAGTVAEKDGTVAEKDGKKELTVQKYEELPARTKREKKPEK